MLRQEATGFRRRRRTCPVRSRGSCRATVIGARTGRLGRAGIRADSLTAGGLTMPWSRTAIGHGAPEAEVTCWTPTLFTRDLESSVKALTTSGKAGGSVPL